MDKVGATYYFRRVVPDHLRPYFRTESGKPRTEFKISLKTKDRREANRLCELKAVETSALIDLAQRKFDARIPPSFTTTAQRDAQEWAEQERFELQELADQEASQREFKEAVEEEAMLSALRRPNEELYSQLQAMKRMISPDLLDPPEMARRKLMVREAEALKGAEKASEAFVRGALGKPDYPVLMDVFQRYKVVRQPSPAAVKKWKTAIESIQKHVGHDDAGRIKREEIAAWRGALLARGLNPLTVRNGYLGALKAVMNFAVEEGLIKENPVRVAVVKDKQAQVRQKSFYPKEMQVILKATLADHSSLTVTHRLSRRWVPWVCAYTGARVNEITQLRECDIYQETGVWVIKITPEAGTVKSGQARVVPLHNHLIEQGFHKLSKPNSVRPIFYDHQLVPGGKAYAPYMKRGEGLASWVRKLGVTDKGIQPNHAWRHTFRTQGHTVGIPDSALECIMGHAPVNVANTYGHWTVEALKREIDKLPNLDAGWAA